MIKKRNKILTKSISGLIVAILAIMAFVRGNAQIWCYAAAFAIFAAVSISAIVVEYRQRLQYARFKQKKTQRVQPAGTTFEFPETDSPSDAVLLQHVNHRITSYLKSTYPESSWEWISETPVDVVRRGGKGHIRVYDASEFNEAMVTFDDRARILFSMMRVVPLAQLQGKETAGQERVPASLPVDVDAWYSMSGKSVLGKLAADLESRGHSKLVIKDNGDICVTQGKEEVVQDTLYNMPEQMHWPLLVKTMKKNGLAAAVDGSSIVVGW